MKFWQGFILVWQDKVETNSKRSEKRYLLLEVQGWEIR
jgi:hypothetical protein